MNKYTNLLKPEAEALLRSTIGAISGVAIRRITAPPPSGRTPIDVTVSLFGWSPSLNLVKMHWNASVDDVDAAAQGRQLLEAFGRHIEIQRHRAAEGLALGAAAPFGMCDLDGSRDDTQMHHILIDVGLAVLLDMSQDDGLSVEGSNALFDVHNPENGNYDGLEEEYEGNVTDRNCDPIEDMHHGIRGRILFIDVPIGDGSFDGLRLRLPRTLPEVALAAAFGRRLGDVVDVPDAIADHVVVEASRTEEGVCIDVEPQLKEVGLLLDGFATATAERT